MARSRLLISYVITFGLVGLLFAGRLFLHPLLGDGAPLLGFLLAVMVNAWYGRVGPGSMATILSAITGVYFFTEPRLQMLIHEPVEIFRLALFLFEGVLLTFLIQTLHNSKKNLETTCGELDKIENSPRVPTAPKAISWR